MDLRHSPLVHLVLHSTRMKRSETENPVAGWNTSRAGFELFAIEQLSSSVCVCVCAP